MAIPTLYAPAYFTGNGSTVTAYVCPWKALKKANLRVIATDADGNESAVLSDGSGITVTLVGNTVEFTTTAAYDSTYTLTAFLTSDFLQSVDLQNSGNNDVNVREDMFDKLTLMLQIALNSVSETTGIPISFPAGEDPVTQTIPTAPNRLNSFLYFNNAGDLTTYAYSTLLQDILNFIDGTDVADQLATKVVERSASFELSEDKAFKLHRCDATSGIVTVTCPQNSDAAISVGARFDISLVSATNSVAFAAGSGATVVSAVGATPSIATQYAGATVQKVATNSFQVFGRIT